MQVSNEELARRIQSGERDLLLELWKNVRRFVYGKAGRWWRAWQPNRPGLEVDDLAQCGYIAMCEAVEGYAPEHGSFITWLNYALLTAFSVEVGCRTPAQLKRPENGAVSLYTPIGGDTEDITFCDMIEDPDALQAFTDAEERLYQDQVKAVVRETLATLPERQEEVVRLRYLEGLTLKETGRRIGITLEVVRQHENKAFRRLNNNPKMQELYYGERNLYRGTSLGSWQRTGCSIQELELIRQEKGSH